MIAGSIVAALAQMSDSRFQGVLLRGIGLTLALLIGAYFLVFWTIGWLVPETITLPFIGGVSFVDDFASWGSLVLMFIMSIFLMVPVASAFTGLFLDDVADAVEAEHYPGLAPAHRLGWAESLRESLTFLGVLIGANIAALLAYLIFAPFAPFIFYGLNGFLLGREYYRMIAVRRLGATGAKAAFRQNLGTIWVTGAIMAVPLTVPIINLAVPILGAAAFTHLYHRLDTRG